MEERYRIMDGGTNGGWIKSEREEREDRYGASGGMERGIE